MAKKRKKQIARKQKKKNLAGMEFEEEGCAEVS
jgi:hypothetical protein